jgi:hypothetical protein
MAGKLAGGAGLGASACTPTAARSRALWLKQRDDPGLGVVRVLARELRRVEVRLAPAATQSGGESLGQNRSARRAGAGR